MSICRYVLDFLIDYPKKCQKFDIKLKDDIKLHYQPENWIIKFDYIHVENTAPEN